MAIWDQTARPQGEGETPPEGFPMGVEYDRAKINEALLASDTPEALQIVPQLDTSGSV